MATPTEAELLAGIVSTLEAVQGLHPLRYPTPRMNPPVAIPLCSWGVKRGYGATHGPVDVELIVLTRWADGGPQVLADYCSPTGAKSIPAAIEAAPTLGVDGVGNVHVYEVSEPRLYEYPDNTPFWGRSIRMKVYV